MRPEFSRGSVEFKVGKEYCVRPPQQPIYVFAVDVSPAAVSSGMMRAALDAISECIDHLPGGDKGEQQQHHPHTGPPSRPALTHRWW